MSEMPFEKFSEMLVYVDKINEKSEFINNLIAIIYSAEEKYCVKLPEYVKTVLLWYWLGSYDFICEKFPRTFSGKSAGRTDIYSSQMKMIDQLAKNDLAKKEAVKQAPLFDALYTIECACKMQEKREKIRPSSENHLKIKLRLLMAEIKLNTRAQ